MPPNFSIASLKRYAPKGYLQTAAYMGIAWAAALSLAPAGRMFVFNGSQRERWLLIPIYFGLMVVASVSVAQVFRERICKADRGEGAWNALLLPLFGCFVFSLAYGFFHRGINFRYNDLESLIYVPIALIEGFYFAAVSFYVVIPMGFISQRVMQQAGASEASA